MRKSIRVRWKYDWIDFRMDGLDCLITAHVHKGAITKPRKIMVDTRNNKISYKQFVCVTSTPWMDYGGYALRGMMIPASTDIQVLEIMGSAKKIRTIW